MLGRDGKGALARWAVSNRVNDVLLGYNGQTLIKREGTFAPIVSKHWATCLSVCDCGLLRG